MPSGSPLAAFRSGSSARNGLSLACNGLALQRFHSRVKAPGLLLRCSSLTLPLPGPPVALPPDPVCTLLRQPRRYRPVAASSSCLTNRFSGLHSPSGLLCPSGSKRSAGLAVRSTRLPNPPDFPSLPAAVFLLLVNWLRINVPGPLLFRRLAVPQTSWNLTHYDPLSRNRQEDSH
jgi:hypothetical protein